VSGSLGDHVPSNGDSPSSAPAAEVPLLHCDTALSYTGESAPKRSGTARTPGIWARLSNNVAAFVGLNRPPAVPSLRDKKEEYNRLDFETKVDDAAVARLILAEVKDQSERKRTAHRTVEGKATSIIGFAIVVLGFVAQYRSGTLLAMGWWIAPTFLLELVAIVCGTMALKPQEHALPDAFRYNFSTVVEEPQNETRIALALAHKWAIHERVMDAGGRRRSIRMSVAFAAFLLGIAYTVFVAFLNVFQMPPAGQRPGPGSPKVTIAIPQTTPNSICAYRSGAEGTAKRRVFDCSSSKRLRNRSWLTSTARRFATVRSVE
jgi:hypothetical protein